MPRRASAVWLWNSALGPAGYLEREVTLMAQQWGFPLQRAFGVVRRLTELCDTLETSANAAGEVRVLIQQ